MDQTQDSSAQPLPIAPPLPPAGPRAAPATSSSSGLITVVAIVVVLAVIGAVFGDKDGSRSGGAGRASGGDLVVSELDWKYEHGMKSAVGKVTNKGSKTYSYAQVEINVYDSTKTLIGSTLANVNNLSPGTSWRFEAPILEDGAKEFRIIKVTGF